MENRSFIIFFKHKKRFFLWLVILQTIMMKYVSSNPVARIALLDVDCSSGSDHQTWDNDYYKFIDQVSQTRLESTLYRPIMLNTLMDHHLRDLVARIKRHFVVSDPEDVKDIIYIFMVLDQVHFFRENIALYHFGTEFLIFIDTQFPELINDILDVISYLLMCLLLTQKFFIDNPVDNHSVSLLFGLSVEPMNDMEINVLTRLGFCFPYNLCSRLCSDPSGGKEKNDHSPRARPLLPC